MQDLGDLLLLLLAGLSGGFLAGMVGIGGGVIYVLIFTSYLREATHGNIEQDVLIKLTISNSVFSLIFAGISGTWKQYRMNNFYARPVLLIGLGGVIGAVLTTWALHTTDLYGKKAFGIAFSIILIPAILKMLLSKEPVKEPLPAERHPGFLSLLGLVTGFGTALSGLGGGFMVIPVLNGVLRVPFKKTISISLGVIMIISFGLSAFNLTAVDYSYLNLDWLTGSILFPMVLPVIAGVAIGAPVGVYVSKKLPAKALRIFFLCFSAITIIKLYWDAL